MFEEPYRWTEAVGNRRAYVDAHQAKRPNGSLLKRWPAETLDPDSCEL